MKPRKVSCTDCSGVGNQVLSWDSHPSLGSSESIHSEFVIESEANPTKEAIKNEAKLLASRFEN